MVREEIRSFRCGFNKSKYDRKMKFRIEHGLNLSIYKLAQTYQKDDPIKAWDRIRY